MFKEGPGWIKVSPVPPSLWTEIITLPPYLSWCPAPPWKATQRELAKLQPPALPGGTGTPQGHYAQVLYNQLHIWHDMTCLFPHSWGENPKAGWWQWRCHRTAGSQWCPVGAHSRSLEWRWEKWQPGSSQVADPHNCAGSTSIRAIHSAHLESEMKFCTLVPGARKVAENASHFKYFTIAFFF